MSSYNDLEEGEEGEVLVSPTSSSNSLKSSSSSLPMIRPPPVPSSTGSKKKNNTNNMYGGPPSLSSRSTGNTPSGYPYSNGNPNSRPPISIVRNNSHTNNATNVNHPPESHLSSRNHSSSNTGPFPHNNSNNNNHPSRSGSASNAPSRSGPMPPSSQGYPYNASLATNRSSSSSSSSSLSSVPHLSSHHAPPPPSNTNNPNHRPPNNRSVNMNNNPRGMLPPPNPPNPSALVSTTGSRYSTNTPPNTNGNNQSHNGPLIRRPPPSSSNMNIDNTMPPGSTDGRILPTKISSSSVDQRLSGPLASNPVPVPSRSNGTNINPSPGGPSSLTGPPPSFHSRYREGSGNGERSLSSSSSHGPLSLEDRRHPPPPSSSSTYGPGSARPPSHPNMMINRSGSGTNPNSNNGNTNAPFSRPNRSRSPSWDRSISHSQYRQPSDYPPNVRPPLLPNSNHPNRGGSPLLSSSSSVPSSRNGSMLNPPPYGRTQGPYGNPPPPSSSSSALQQPPRGPGGMVSGKPNPMNPNNRMSMYGPPHGMNTNNNNNNPNERERYMTGEGRSMNGMYPDSTVPPHPSGLSSALMPGSRDRRDYRGMDHGMMGNTTSNNSNRNNNYHDRLSSRNGMEMHSNGSRSLARSDGGGDGYGRARLTMDRFIGHPKSDNDSTKNATTTNNSNTIRSPIRRPERNDSMGDMDDEKDNAMAEEEDDEGRTEPSSSTKLSVTTKKDDLPIYMSRYNDGTVGPKRYSSLLNDNIKINLITAVTDLLKESGVTATAVTNPVPPLTTTGTDGAVSTPVAPPSTPSVSSSVPGTPVTPTAGSTTSYTFTKPLPLSVTKERIVQPDTGALSNIEKLTKALTEVLATLEKDIPERKALIESKRQAFTDQQNRIAAKEAAKEAAAAAKAAAEAEAEANQQQQLQLQAALMDTGDSTVTTESIDTVIPVFPLPLTETDTDTELAVLQLMDQGSISKTTALTILHILSIAGTWSPNAAWLSQITYALPRSLLPLYSSHTSVPATVSSVRSPGIASLSSHTTVSSMDSSVSTMTPVHTNTTKPTVNDDEDMGIVVPGKKKKEKEKEKDTEKESSYERAMALQRYLKRTAVEQCVRFLNNGLHRICSINGTKNNATDGIDEELRCILFDDTDSMIPIPLGEKDLAYNGGRNIGAVIRLHGSVPLAYRSNLTEDPCTGNVSLIVPGKLPKTVIYAFRPSGLSINRTIYMTITSSLADMQKVCESFAFIPSPDFRTRKKLSAFLGSVPSTSSFLSSTYAAGSGINPLTVPIIPVSPLLDHRETWLFADGVRSSLLLENRGKGVVANMELLHRLHTAHCPSTDTLGTVAPEVHLVAPWKLRQKENFETVVNDACTVRGTSNGNGNYSVPEEKKDDYETMDDDDYGTYARKKTVITSATPSFISLTLKQALLRKRSGGVTKDNDTVTTEEAVTSDAVASSAADSVQPYVPLYLQALQNKVRTLQPSSSSAGPCIDLSLFALASTAVTKQYGKDTFLWQNIHRTLEQHSFTHSFLRPHITMVIKRERAIIRARSIALASAYLTSRSSWLIRCREHLRQRKLRALDPIRARKALEEQREAALQASSSPRFAGNTNSFGNTGRRAAAVAAAAAISATGTLTGSTSVSTPATVEKAKAAALAVLAAEEAEAIDPETDLPPESDDENSTNNLDGMQVRSEWELQQRLEALARRERQTLARLQYAAAVPDMIPTKRQQKLRMLSYNANHRLTTDNAPILCRSLPARTSCNALRVGGAEYLLPVEQPFDQLVGVDTVRLPSVNNRDNVVKEKAMETMQDTLVNYDNEDGRMQDTLMSMDIIGTLTTSSDTASSNRICYLPSHTERNRNHPSHCTAQHPESLSLSTSIPSFNPTSINNIPPDRVQLWFGGCNCPIAVELHNRYINPWSDSEKLIFADKFMQYPKDFPTIASFLPNKTASDCIAYYYATKHVAGYKLRLKAAGLAAKRKGGAQTGWLQACGAARDIGVPIHADTARGGWLKDKAKKVVNVSQRVQDLAYSRLFIHPGPYARIHSLHRFVTVPLPLTTILPSTVVAPGSLVTMNTSTVNTPFAVTVTTPSKGDKNKDTALTVSTSTATSGTKDVFSGLPKDVRNEFIFAYGLGYASLPWSNKFPSVINTEQSPDPLTYMPQIAAMQAGSGAGIGGSLVRVYMAADALTRSETRKYSANTNTKTMGDGNNGGKFIQQCQDLAKAGLVCPGNVDPGRFIPPSVLPLYGTVYGAIGNGPAGLSNARFPVLPTVLAYLNDYLSKELVPMLMTTILRNKDRIVSPSTLPNEGTDNLYQEAKRLAEQICLPLNNYEDDRVIGFVWRLLCGGNDDQFSLYDNHRPSKDVLLDPSLLNYLTQNTDMYNNRNDRSFRLPIGASTLLPIQSRLRLASFRWSSSVFGRRNDLNDPPDNSTVILTLPVDNKDDAMKTEDRVLPRGVPDVTVPTLVTTANSFTSTVQSNLTMKPSSQPSLHITTTDTVNFTSTTTLLSTRGKGSTSFVSPVPVDLQRILDTFPSSLRSLVEYLIHTTDVAKQVSDASASSMSDSSSINAVSSPVSRKGKKQVEAESSTSSGTTVSSALSSALTRLSVVSTGEFYTPNGPTVTLRYFDPLGTPYSYYGHGDISGIFPHSDLVNEARAYNIADMALARKGRRIYARNGTVTNPPPHLRSSDPVDDMDGIGMDDGSKGSQTWVTRRTTSASNQSFLANINRSVSEMSAMSSTLLGVNEIENEPVHLGSALSSSSSLLTSSSMLNNVHSSSTASNDVIDASPYVSEAEDQTTYGIIGTKRSHVDASGTEATVRKGSKRSRIDSEGNVAEEEEMDDEEGVSNDDDDENGGTNNRNTGEQEDISERSDTRMHRANGDTYGDEDDEGNYAVSSHQDHQPSYDENNQVYMENADDYVNNVDIDGNPYPETYGSYDNGDQNNAMMENGDDTGNRYENNEENHHYDNNDHYDDQNYANDDNQNIDHGEGYDNNGNPAYGDYPSGEGEEGQGYGEDDGDDRTRDHTGYDQYNDNYTYNNENEQYNYTNDNDEENDGNVVNPSDQSYQPNPTDTNKEEEDDDV